MATFAWLDAYLKLGAVDLSAHVKSVTFNQTAAMLDDTAMGDTAVSVIKGLEADTIEVQFNADPAAAAVEATLAAIGVGGSDTFEIRPKSDAVSATNPKWTGTVFLSSYTPIGGTVGDLAGVSASFVVSGGSTRAEA